MPYWKVENDTICDQSIIEILDKLYQDPAIRSSAIFQESPEGEISLDINQAVQLFDLYKGKREHETTIGDFYALNKILQPENRLTVKSFWDLGRFFESCFNENLSTGHHFIPPKHEEKPFVANEKEINSGGFLSQIRRESKHHPVVLYFEADWCRACKQMGPYRKQLFNHPRIKGYLADVSKPGALENLDDELSEEGIDRSTIPYVLVYYGGSRKFKGHPQKLKNSGLVGDLLHQSQSPVHHNMRLLAGDRWKKYPNTIKDIMSLPKENPLAGVLDQRVYEWTRDFLDKPTAKEKAKIFHDFEFYLRSFKSSVAFSNLGQVALEKTNAKEKKSIDVLVPASGHLVSPLLIAMKLIDQKAIEKAHFTFTEIDSKIPKKLMRVLSYWASQKEAMSEPEIIAEEKQEACDKGAADLTTIRFYWQGYPILIDVKVNHDPASGYFAKEDARKADLVVYHDIGIYTTVPDDVVALGQLFSALVPEDVNYCLPLPDKRVLAINKFDSFTREGYHWLTRFAQPYTTNVLYGNYGHSMSLAINPIRAGEETLHELGTAAMKGRWISLDQQPYLKLLRNKEEAEHFVDLGIAALRFYSKEKKDPIRFQIRRGSLRPKDVDVLLEFGFDLQKRLDEQQEHQVKPVNRVKAVERFQFLLMALLFNALTEPDGYEKVAAKHLSRLIKSLKEDENQYLSWYATLSHLHLLQEESRDIEPQSEWIRRGIDLWKEAKAHVVSR